MVIKRFWRDVNIARPDYRSIINFSQSKQWKCFYPHERSFIHVGGHIENTFLAVFEFKAQNIIWLNLDFKYKKLQDEI
jgi:hypothetical protein